MLTEREIRAKYEGVVEGSLIFVTPQVITQRPELCRFINKAVVQRVCARCGVAFFIATSDLWHKTACASCTEAVKKTTKGTVKFRKEVINGKEVTVKIIETKKTPPLFYAKRFPPTMNICGGCGGLKKGTKWFEELGYFACPDCQEKAKIANNKALKARLAKEAEELRAAEAEAREYEAQTA